MPHRPAKLKISAPIEPIPPGRGFYQLEEDTLLVQVGVFDRRRRFFSYLQSEHVCLQLDRRGRLIFVELDVPRRHWQRHDELLAPARAEIADIRWLDFRRTVPEPELLTNHNLTTLQMRFRNGAPARSYFLAEHVVLQTDIYGHLSAIWIDDIIDDLAGQDLAAYRRSFGVRDSAYWPEQVEAK